MIIHKPQNIRFSANLSGFAELFGINPALKPITIIKQLNSPITYFVHCNLIDKRQNLLNGKPSTVLAKEFAYIKQNKPRMDITARAHKAIGLMIIHNLKNIRFSANLAELFGINPALKPITIIKQLNSPITYFVHCNLIDKRQTCSMGNLQLSWRNSIFAANPLKGFTSKHRNNMFCVTRRAATMMLIASRCLLKTKTATSLPSMTTLWSLKLR